MKKMMLILLAFVMTMCLPAMSDNDKVITFDQLPAQAQSMLKQYFGDKVPLVITADRNDFYVIYQSGEKLEFGKEGNWREIECKSSCVPDALVPEQIKAEVGKRFPGATIIKIDRDRRGYDLELSNGLDVEFNKKFQMIEIDD